MSISVSTLRSILQDALDKLEDFSEGSEIQTQCNTYGLHGHILELGEGFVSLDDLQLDEDSEDEA